MDTNDLIGIENQIDYKFKNRDLLQQAFVRRSYSVENGGANNEVLEFIGDKALDFVVVQLLTEEYGYMASECDDFNRDECNEFYSECDEGELTEIKSKLVQRKNLAERIDMLGFADFLIMGKSDINGHAEEKDAVKEGIIGILKNTYEMEEEDFMSAELEVVPAGRAREMGFDRSMIMAYGQDDKVCAYTSLVAMLETDKIDKTACCLLVDKEEVGSIGATGMQSRFFENAVAELMDRVGEYSELKLRRALANSKMLSSDVTAAFDPNYAGAYEKKNSAFFGKGLAFAKYTGARGKSGCNDANAEFVAWLRNVMDENDVAYQMAELGKVDQGGGGTIAYILAEYGMEVIDCGVALQNMHAPWEVASKVDIFETMRGYKAFLMAE